MSSSFQILDVFVYHNLWLYAKLLQFPESHTSVMHLLHPAIAWIWKTAKPCFMPGSLCEFQSCLYEKHLVVHLRQARNYALMWIELTHNPSAFSSPSEAFMHLLTQWGWIMHRDGSPDSPVCDHVPFRLCNKTQWRRALLSYMLSFFFTGRP